MTQEEKIDYMIQSLKLAKEEIAYAKEYNEQKAKGNGYISGKRAWMMLPVSPLLPQRS